MVQGVKVQVERVVLTAAYDGGVLDSLIGLLRAAVRPSAGAAGVFVVGGLSAGLSAMVNNLPAALLGVFALGSGHAATHAAT